MCPQRESQSAKKKTALGAVERPSGGGCRYRHEQRGENERRGDKHL